MDGLGRGSLILQPLLDAPQTLLDLLQFVQDDDVGFFASIPTGLASLEISRSIEVKTSRGTSMPLMATSDGISAWGHLQKRTV